MSTEQVVALLQRILTLHEPYRSLVLQQVSTLIEQAEQAFPKEKQEVAGVIDVPEAI